MSKYIYLLAAISPLIAMLNEAKAQSGRGVGPSSDLPPGVVIPTGDLAKDLRVFNPTLQSELAANDADWAVIVNKIGAVEQAAGQIGYIAGLRYRDIPHYGRNGTLDKPVPWQSLHLSPVQVAAEELNDVLRDPNTPAEVISSRLEAFRAIRAKYEADLRVAKEELRKILNQRQEAVMVAYGWLD